jgi:hypothetical protein
VLTSHLEDLAVKVEDASAAGTFVEIVNILGDDVDVEVLLQPGETEVGGVGLGFGDVAAPHIIKVENQRRIPSPGAGGSDFGDFKAFPEAVGITKGLQATFGADAGAGEDDDLFLFGCRLHGKQFNKKTPRIGGSFEDWVEF